MYDKFVAAAERALRRPAPLRRPGSSSKASTRHFAASLSRRGSETRFARRSRRERGGESWRRSSATPETAGASTSPSAVRVAKSARADRPSGSTILSNLDMSQAVAKKDFATELERVSGPARICCQRKAEARGVSTILVFEGWDAAGKGGAIRRITGALDARSYQVIPIAAPTDEERAHHYLWRFWRHLSRAGRLTIFDRSWYGRVLVERVEGFRDGGRMATRLFRDWRVRRTTRRARHRARQVLGPHLAGRAAATIQGASAGAVQAVEADRRGLA